MIEVWTDGACEPNPGPGSWAWCTTFSERTGFCETKTTNNRMELTAIIEAMKEFRGQEVKIHSDSEYCVNGLNEWRLKWKKAGWKRGGQEVKNLDLWLAADELLSTTHGIYIVWVRGHSGNEMNEYADALCDRTLTNFMKRTPRIGRGGHLQWSGDELLPL